MDYPAQTKTKSCTVSPSCDTEYYKTYYENKLYSYPIIHLLTLLTTVRADLSWENYITKSKGKLG